MRAYATVAVLVSLAAPAWADENCTRGSGSVVTLKEWSIEPIDERSNAMTETLVLQAAKPIRMIDGSIIYADVLGDRIGSKAIDRDVKLVSGEEYTQTGQWGPHTFERLLEMNRDDVVAIACVEAVVYADGSTEKFVDEPAQGSLADAIKKALEGKS